MPRLVSMGRNREEKEALTLAKGKNGTRLSDRLAAAADDMLYEFGFVPKPTKKD